MRREERVRANLETWPAPVVAALIERGYIASWPLELTKDGWRVLGSLSSYRQIEVFVEDDLGPVPASVRLARRMAEQGF